jgi:hypothetical protein
MNIMRRPVTGYGIHNHTQVHVCPGFPGRPVDARGAVAMTGPAAANMSGPRYMGMDPSDPATYVRNWNPAAGMIGYLNFDGAQLQGRTPTGGLQRGPQQRRPRKLRVGM